MIDPFTAFAAAQAAVKGIQAAIKLGKHACPARIVNINSGQHQKLNSDERREDGG